MWQHSFIVGWVLLLASSDTLSRDLLGVSTPEASVLAGSRWTLQAAGTGLQCVRLGNQKGWVWGEAVGVPNVKHFLLISHYSTQGQINWSLPGLWLTQLPPSALTLVPCGRCEAEETSQGLALRNPAVTGQQARQLKRGCPPRLCLQTRLKKSCSTSWPPACLLAKLVAPLHQLCLAGCSTRLENTQPVRTLWRSRGAYSKVPAW